MKRITAAVCFGTVLGFMLASVTPAQETPKVDDLDTLLSSDKTSQEEKRGKENPLYKAVKAAKWTWMATGYIFVERNENQDENKGDDTKSRQAYTQALVDTWLEAGGIETKIDLVLQFGSESDQYDSRRVIYPSQLYVKKRIEDSDLIAGYKYVEDGISTLYSPSNRLARVDGDHPTDPDKLGVWQASWTYYSSGNNSSELRLMPYFKESRIPPESSRWMAVKGDFNLVGIDYEGNEAGDGQTSENKIHHGVKDIGYMVKQKVTVENADLFASAYRGYLPQPVTKRSDNKSEKEYIKGVLVSGGFSTARGTWEYHGELVYQIPVNRKDDQYINYVLGAEHDINLLFGIKGIDSAKLTVEYANEWVIKDRNHPDYPVDQKPARVGRNAVYILQRVDIDDKNKVFYRSSCNISKGDNMHRVGYEYEFGEGNSAEVGYEWFNGKQETHFGRWSDNDRLIFKFTKKF